MFTNINEPYLSKQSVMKAAYVLVFGMILVPFGWNAEQKEKSKEKSRRYLEESKVPCPNCGIKVRRGDYKCPYCKYVLFKRKITSIKKSMSILLTITGIQETYRRPSIMRYGGSEYLRRRQGKLSGTSNRKPRIGEIIYI